MPASDTIDFERDFAELVRELRALPTAASPELRERVRALEQPEARRTVRLPRFSRRTLLVLAPACAVALVAAAIVHGVLSSSPTRHQALSGSASEAKRNPGGDQHAATLKAQSDNTHVLAPPYSTAVLPPNPNRYQDYQASLRLRVKDFDALGRRTADAMQIVRGLGGYVASVDQTTTRGAPGQADLVLRVPVANVQTALIRLSALGTVLDQHVSIRDLNALVNAQRQRILQLKLQIARITAALQQPLSADERLRLEFQLDQDRRALQQATGANKSTLRQAALSRIELTLATQQTAAATTHHRGRAGRAVHSAVAFLAGAGAVALAALIILSPLLVIGALAYWGMRAYRRREEARLLAAP